MSWIKLDDEFPDHPKVEDLSDRAFRLYVHGLCHCGRKLTDGKLSQRDIKTLMAQIGATRRHVRELEDAGLWIGENGHRVVNDFLEYNPTREKVLADRAAARDRMQALRSQARSGERSPVSSATPIPSSKEGMGSKDVEAPSPGGTAPPDIVRRLEGATYLAALEHAEREARAWGSNPNKTHDTFGERIDEIARHYRVTFDWKDQQDLLNVMGDNMPPLGEVDKEVA